MISTIECLIKVWSDTIQHGIGSSSFSFFAAQALIEIPVSRISVGALSASTVLMG